MKEGVFLDDTAKRNAIIGLVIGVVLLAVGIARLSAGNTFFGALFVLLGIANIVGGVIRYRKATGA